MPGSRGLSALDAAGAAAPFPLRFAATCPTRPDPGRAGIDPVARFHLGDASPRRARESLGAAVNHVPDPGAVEANRAAFVRSGEAARSPAADALSAAPRSARGVLGGGERGGAEPG